MLIIKGLIFIVVIFLNLDLNDEDLNLLFKDNMKKLFFLVIVFLSVDAFALDIGSEAPDFKLKSITGSESSLAQYKGKNVVLEWFNAGCPFVKKHYKDGDMQALQKYAKENGLVWLVINSTNIDHEDYLSPETFAAKKDEWQMESSDILLDSTGEVGRLYSAKSTPHMFIVSKEGKLIYQGAIDDKPSPFEDPKQANNYIKSAIDSLVKGENLKISETKAYGCSIKYAD